MPRGQAWIPAITGNDKKESFVIQGLASFYSCPLHFQQMAWIFAIAWNDTRKGLIGDDIKAPV